MEFPVGGAPTEESVEKEPVMEHLCWSNYPVPGLHVWQSH